MDKMIKIINFTGCGFIAATMFFGFMAGHAVNTFIVHVYIALFAASLTILGQVAIFFYLLATGASIKESVGTVDFGELDAIKETRYFKKKAFPFAMLGIMFAIAVTALGGAVHTGLISTHIHAAVAFCALGINIFSTINAGKCFERNKVLIMKVIESEPVEAVS